MKTSKLRYVSIPKEWKGDKGTFYFFDIELENGDKGNIGSKDQSPSFLKVGESLDYELKETDKGNKIKRVSQQPFNKGGGYKPDTVGITVGACLNNAVSLVSAGKIESKDVEKTASWLIELSFKLKEKYKHLG